MARGAHDAQDAACLSCGKVLPAAHGRNLEEPMKHPLSFARAAALAFILTASLAGSNALAQSGPVKMEWLSWSIFRFTSPTGKVILTNPFVTNPDSPVKVDAFTKVDVILVADGHRDEVGSTDEIAIKTGAKIVTPFEMWTTYFEPRKVPEAQMHRSNPGDWLKLDGLTIRNVAA